MRIWTNFKKWALKPPVDDIDPIKWPRSSPLAPKATGWRATVPGDCLRMVDEPVASFLDSFYRDKKRYVIERIQQEQYTGPIYQWMGKDSYFSILDQQTSKVYHAFVHDNKLSHVTGLPFNLNHWEFKALYIGIRYHRREAKDRRARITASRTFREQQAAYQAEKRTREDFAHQFR